MQPRALSPASTGTDHVPRSHGAELPRRSANPAASPPEVSAACLLCQTSDDDLARRWGDGARSRQVMTKPMTKAAAPIARRRLWLGLELRSPTAERVERNPASLAILTLIELAWYPGLMVRAPESLAITLANWRHLVLHLKIYRREQIASEPRRNKRARNAASGPKFVKYWRMR